MQTERELINIASGFLETNKYLKAIEFFTIAIELNPLNAESFELRGIAWFRIFDIEKALTDITKAIELDPDNHRAWYYKGDILKYTKQAQDAEICYLKANELYPDSLFYLTGLIETGVALKKYDNALNYCNQILNEKPADKIALYYRGFINSMKKNYKAAIKDALKLLEIGQRTATNLNNLGFWYSRIGDRKKAYNNLTLALQINPTHPYALNNLGFVWYLESDFKKALELITDSIEIDPSNSYAYKNRALVYLKMGIKELAFDDLTKANLLGYSEDYDDEVNEIIKINFTGI